jgi:predicted enzyme related to lactoylglutathione lyase
VGPGRPTGVDFWVGDVDRAVGAAPQLGGAVVAPPYDLPMFRQAVLSDPEGSPFSVTQIVIDRHA